MIEQDIQKIVEELLEKLFFVTSVHVSKEGEIYFVDISSDDASLLIGQGGANILALQHIVRLLIRKNHTSEDGGVHVDVNGYWKEKEEFLKKEVLKQAEDLQNSTEEERTLRPMNAHERKIVHSTVALLDGVETESIGFGQDRQVRIRKTSTV